MSASYIVLLLIQTILIIVLATIIYILVMSNISLDLEKRFDSYTLTSTDNFSVPLFQRVFNIIWNIVHKISRIISKSEVIKKYASKYDKYVNEDRNNISNVDYISIKIIISSLFALIYSISSLFRNNFDIIFMLIIFLSLFLLMDIYFKIEYKNRRKKIEKDLLSAIIVMNNAFKSGMNVMQAVNIVVNELDGPIKYEFKKISLDIEYGLSLETVFDRFYNRVKIEDVKYITSSLSLINRTGGNIVKVFNAVEKNFYNKKKVQDEMKALTSSSNFMFKLLVFMPVILSLIILILNPNYFSPLLNTKLGLLILLVIITLYIIYIFVVKKIMKVEM